MKLWDLMGAKRTPRLGCGALGLVALLQVPGAGGVQQTVPAGIVDVQQPASGRAVFDTAGNAYYLWVPPGWSEMETAPGSGICIGGPRPGVLPCLNAFVTKVDPSGNQAWVANLGGPSIDSGTALAVDKYGNVAFTGSTSGQFPTTPGAAIESSTTSKVFAARASADGSKFLYSTYLPESLAYSSAIAVDGNGVAYIGGSTSAGDAFVLKLSADGSTILYNTTLTGSGAEAVTAIALDSVGDVLLAGRTTSPDLPVTTGAFQRHLNGAQNCFLARLDPVGRLLSVTYFGGSGSESPSSIAIDGVGNINLAGYTSSLDLPTTPGTLQPGAIVPSWNTFGPGGFVAQFAPDAISLKWASYVISSDVNPLRPNWDAGVSALAIGAAGDIYIGGLTGPGFPVTPSAPVLCFPGFSSHANGFLAHLNANGALLDATYVGSQTTFGGNRAGGILPTPDGDVLMAWTASRGGVVSRVRYGNGGAMPSPCLSTNVMNAATQSAAYGIAPGELLTLTGFGIGPDVGVAYQPDEHGDIPTQLGGVQVLFDGRPVPIMYAQSQQINAIAPGGLAVNGTTQITVAYAQRQFGPVNANVIPHSPGIFRLQPGASAQAAAINQDGTLNGPTNPATRGSIVAMWGTGYGLTDPPCLAGGLNHPYPSPLGPGATALMSIVDPNRFGILNPAQYAGSAPTQPCGVVQINFRIPDDSASGISYFVPLVQATKDNTMIRYESQVGVSIIVK